MSFSTTGFTTLLDGAIDAQVTDLFVDNGDILGGPRRVVIQIGTEQILVDLVAGEHCSGCTRGYNGTTAAAHSDNATVTLMSEDIVSDTTDLADQTHGVLEPTGVTAGSYGAVDHVPVLTVDAKGRVTAASTVLVKRASSSAPANASAAGVAGDVAFDATHIYVCIATNTWVRATLATW